MHMQEESQEFTIMGNRVTYTIVSISDRSLLKEKVDARYQESHTMPKTQRHAIPLKGY